MVGIAFDRKRLILKRIRAVFFLPDWYNSTKPAKDDIHVEGPQEFL